MLRVISEMNYTHCIFTDIFASKLMKQKIAVLYSLACLIFLLTIWPELPLSSVELIVGPNGPPMMTILSSQLC